jgi:hypothetical protein
MLILGNVHKVVPKGANSGLNGNSVQPTGVVPKRCFDPSPEYKFAVILWPSLEIDFHGSKGPAFCPWKEQSPTTVGLDCGFTRCNFQLLREGSNSGFQS